MVIETERLLLREMTEEDFPALYKVLADSDIMKHYPYVFDENRIRNWILRNIERYRAFGFGLWAVCLKATIAYGCKQVGEFKDDVNEITKVFAITREEWIN